MLICGKKNADGTWPRKAASQLSPADLRSKIAYAEKNRSGWKSEWADKNEKELTAMKAWLAYKEIDPCQPGLDMPGEDGPNEASDYRDEVPF
jgi:hypothetical protein